MSFKEVKELRKSGNLQEALNVALKDLENDSENIWNKRSIAWVYFDYLKLNIKPENFEEFKLYLEKIISLELPEDEKMIFDNCAFQIGKLIFSLDEKNSDDNVKAAKLYILAKRFQFSKPSESYSFLLKALHKNFKNKEYYNEMIDWWGLNNFSEDDFKEDEVNGKKMMSLVELVYVSYAKGLLETPYVFNDGVRVNLIIENTHYYSFLEKLDEIIEQHPEYQYPPYFKAKLLLLLGDKENILSAFLPFAKKKRNDFWVWELLSDVFQSDDERKLACLCKALSLKTPESFLINTRQKIAELLIKSCKYNEAKTEIEKIIHARQENGWKIPRQIGVWTEQSWYENAENSNNNYLFYKKHLVVAEDILFSDVPEEIVVVEFVNSSKLILNFIKDKNKHGYFSYKDYLENPVVGDILKVRINAGNNENYFKLLSAKILNEDSTCSAIKTFDGKIKIINTSGIGFVDDVFFSKDFIAKYDIKENQTVKGKAMLSFNKSKNDWGWKVFRIKNEITK